MSFNGSAVTSMESEAMIKNVVMNVLSRNTRVTYGQYELNADRQRQKEVGADGRQRSKDVCWLMRESAP